MSGKQTEAMTIGGGTDEPLVSGECYSMDFTIGSGGVNAMNNAASEVTQICPRFHFKAQSLTLLADSNNSGTINIGSRSIAKFPLTSGAAVSHRHVRLDSIGVLGTTAGDILHITFVAE